MRLEGQRPEAKGQRHSLPTPNSQLRITAFTGGQNVPSARFRVRQYIEPLADLGVFVDEHFSRAGRYPPVEKWKRPFWATTSLTGQFSGIAHSHKTAITWLQKEMLSTFYTLEGLTKAPRILDIDDAIFLRKEGKSAKKLAAISDIVLCGNSFLAEQMNQWHNDVIIVPTAIDTARYTPTKTQSSRPIIGWIGQGGAFPHLYEIEPALRIILQAMPDAQLHVMADVEPKFKTLPANQVVFKQWSAETEIGFLQSLSVGLMPLPDSLWARGKCSYKMLTYLATGVPVVVSPIGMNKDILAQADCGVSATTEAEWIEGVLGILRGGVDGEMMGKNGRLLIEQQYDTKRVANQLAQVFRKLS